MTQQALLCVAVLCASMSVMSYTAYADHVDNHIWIETAEGGFVMASNSVQSQIDKAYRAWYGSGSLTYVQACGIPDISLSWHKPESLYINNILMIDQRKGDCGNKLEEENYFETIGNNLEKTEEQHKKYHECMCGYMYENTVNGTYTYTIVDLPRDRELPPDYKDIVVAGVQAGFDVWGNINDIDFEYTTSRLDADIIIQQQIGDATAFGNTDIGCLFDHAQCTIQLFSDLNVHDQQTLVNAKSIQWTIAHEFGHLIGLPHHIEPDHVMNTVFDEDVRTYYEARNINVPTLAEPTVSQRLLANDNSLPEVYGPQLPTTSIGVLEHYKTIAFKELLMQILDGIDSDYDKRVLLNNVFNALRLELELEQ